MPQDEQQAGLIPLKPPVNAARAQRMVELYKKLLGINPWKLELQRIGTFDEPAWKQALTKTRAPAPLRSALTEDTEEYWRARLNSFNLPTTTYEFPQPILSQMSVLTRDPSVAPHDVIQRALGGRYADSYMPSGGKILNGSPDQVTKQMLDRAGVDAVHMGFSWPERPTTPNQSLLNEYAWLHAKPKKSKKK